MVETACPASMIGRIIALDIGLFLNVGNFVSVVGSGLLYDHAKLNPKQLSLVQVGVGIVSTLLVCLWAYWTCNIEHEEYQDQIESALCTRHE